MENKRGTTVLLTVIGIATLLVAVVGATFAYFTATVTEDNETTNVTVTSATLGTINFDHGRTIEIGTAAKPAYPGAVDSKTFTVTSDEASTVGVDYVVTMNISKNSFGVAAPEEDDLLAVTPGATNLQYLVCATKGADSKLAADTPECATVLTDGKPNEKAQWLTIDSTKNSYTLATATLGTKGAEDAWQLFVRLNEVKAAQNHDQGKEFAATLSIDATSVGYTTGESGAYTDVVTTKIAG